MVSPPPNAFLIVQPVSEQEPCFRASRYQGEANADVNQTYGYYDCALQALITGWRAAFRKPTAYFGVVMLASYIHEGICPFGCVHKLMRNGVSIILRCH